jgi:hypothetical protein
VGVTVPRKEKARRIAWPLDRTLSPALRRVYGCQATRRSPTNGSREARRSGIAAACRAGVLFTSHPGVSCPHDEQSSDTRPSAKCNSESWPCSPQMNCRSCSPTRDITPDASLKSWCCAESIDMIALPLLVPSFVPIGRITASPRSEVPTDAGYIKRNASRRLHTESCVHQPVRRRSAIGRCRPAVRKSAGAQKSLRWPDESLSGVPTPVF